MGYVGETMSRWGAYQSGKGGQPAIRNQGEEYMYPLEKYKYYRGGSKIVAVSTYAGKTIRGVARCNPRDEFDLEKGKRLAAARCNEKIAKRRYIRACQKCKDAQESFSEAENYYNDMIMYEEDSYQDWERAQDEIFDLINSF